MRLIETHKGSDANNNIDISADDRDEACGNASHNYEVHFQNTAGHEPLARIQFQQGAIKEVGRNGITDEALLAIVLDRLRGFQAGQFSCRENALAITNIEQGLHWMNARTKDRVARGVEGESKE